MRQALWLRVLWAPALLMASAVVCAAVALTDQERMSARFEVVTTLREELDRALARIGERHARTTRRAREALLDPRPETRAELLAWSAQHYAQEMERLLGEARALLGRVRLPDAEPRLGGDLARLLRELDALAARTQEVAPALAALLAAVEGGDPDELLSAQHVFDRADRDMVNALRVVERLEERTWVWQARHVAMSGARLSPALWLFLAALMPVALYLAARPLLRVRRLSLGQPTRPRSAEERHLAERLTRLGEEGVHVRARLDELTRAGEQAQTVERRLGQELALMRLYNDNLMSSLRAAIIVTDAAGRIIGFNRAARTFFGAGPALIDTPMSDHALHKALLRRAPDAREQIERALGERAVLRFEGVPTPAAQGEILLDLTLAPYLDESGSARGLLWVGDDVTVEVRTKNQLLSAERLAAVGRLSAQVAHEIRNPLSAIALNAELLEEDFVTTLPEPKRGEALALLSAIASEIEHLTQVTEGYLRLARLPRPALRDADLNQLVTDLFTMLAEELHAHHIEAVLDLATPAPHAQVDPGQLRQALINIVRNSREAMPKGGVIRVSTRGQNETSAIVIEDTGQGMPPDVVPRVLEPFFTTKSEGTGLGLSLTHEIVTQHGGDIEVSSEPGQGTRVSLTLPAIGSYAQYKHTIE